MRIDDSTEISYLIFFFKLGKMSKKLSSAAVVIDTLRVNIVQFNKTFWWGVKVKDSEQTVQS